MDLIKVSKIKKLPNGKWRVVSHKGKNLGTYKTKEEAQKRLRAVEYFKRQHSLNHFDKLIKIAEVNNSTYSETLRYLRQNYPDQVTNFMNIFSKYFQEGLNQKLQNPEIWALAQTKLKFPEIF